LRCFEEFDVFCVSLLCRSSLLVSLTVLINGEEEAIAAEVDYK